MGPDIDNLSEASPTSVTAMVMAKEGSSAPPLVAGSAILGAMREIKLCICVCFFRKYAVNCSFS